MNWKAVIEFLAVFIAGFVVGEVYAHALIMKITGDLTYLHQEMIKTNSTLIAALTKFTTKL